MYLSCMDKLFISVHWLTVICFSTASLFTGYSNIDLNSWDMTLYCNKKTFNQTLTTIVNKKWPTLTVLSVSVIIIFLLSLEMVMTGIKRRIFLNILNYFLGLLLSWDITYVLKGLISYPIPSFFQNENLSCYYCTESCSRPRLKRFLLLDKKSRGSFPSFTVCATTYSSVFLFLLCCYLDKKQRFIAKLVALIVPGSVSVVYSWYLWHYNENHFEDIFGGAMIGMLLAFYISKEVFLTENQRNRFKDDFVSVLMTRELTLGHPEGNTGENEYTLNLYSDGAAQEQQQRRVMIDSREPPPAYSVF